jgi:hypothetical protein
LDPSPGSEGKALHVILMSVWCNDIPCKHSNSFQLRSRIRCAYWTASMEGYDKRWVYELVPETCWSMPIRAQWNHPYNWSWSHTASMYAHERRTEGVRMWCA